MSLSYQPDDQHQHQARARTPDMGTGHGHTHLARTRAPGTDTWCQGNQARTLAPGTDTWHKARTPGTRHGHRTRAPGTDTWHQARTCAPGTDTNTSNGTFTSQGPKQLWIPHDDCSQILSYQSLNQTFEIKSN